MVAPGAVDVEVLARHAFALEAEPRQQRGAAQVLGQVRGLDAVQLHTRRKHLGDAGQHRLVHQAAAFEIGVDAVTEQRAVKCAAHDR